MNRLFILFYIVDSVGDIDEKMGSQGTLLHFAAERGMTKFAGHLLAASGGAWESLTTKNREGLTPAEIATRQEDVEMMRLFADFEVHSTNQ